VGFYSFYGGLIDVSEVDYGHCNFVNSLLGLRRAK